MTIPDIIAVTENTNVTKLTVSIMDLVRHKDEPKVKDAKKSVNAKR